MDPFICYPPSGKYSNLDQWLAQRNTTKNFDRTMFIADQPKPHVPFLLAFMETQSFVSFVDSKIASRFNEDNHLFGLTNKHLQVFSDRIRLYRDCRDLTYHPCPSIDSIDEGIRRRFTFERCYSHNSNHRKRSRYPFSLSHCNSETARDV